MVYRDRYRTSIIRNYQICTFNHLLIQNSSHAPVIRGVTATHCMYMYSTSWNNVSESKLMSCHHIHEGCKLEQVAAGKCTM